MAGDVQRGRGNVWHAHAQIHASLRTGKDRRTRSSSIRNLWPANTGGWEVPCTVHTVLPLRQATPGEGGCLRRNNKQKCRCPEGTANGQDRDSGALVTGAPSLSPPGP